jgi:hypothetical protein
MTTTLEESTQALRAAVKHRLDNTDPSDEKLIGYKPPPLAGCEPAQACAAEVLSQAWRGDSLLRDGTHPTSQAFYDLCDRLKAMHAGKSQDYGCPSGNDPLANIRNGATFVGIEPWKGAMVRLSDKVTRLATFNATGRLGHEGVEDTLLDLASYSLLALLLYQEEQGGTAAD